MHQLWQSLSKCSRNWTDLLLMAEILHRLIGSRYLLVSHYLFAGSCTVHPRWLAGFLNHQPYDWSIKLQWPMACSCWVRVVQLDLAGGIHHQDLPGYHQPQEPQHFSWDLLEVLSTFIHAQYPQSTGLNSFFVFFWEAPVFQPKSTDPFNDGQLDMLW